MVVYYHELECYAELFCYLQGQGHSEGLYNQYVTVSALSSKLLIHLVANAIVPQLHKTSRGRLTESGIQARGRTPEAST